MNKLSSFIKEVLLTEEVFGSQAFVYHGSNAPPEKLIPILLKDEFFPGQGGGSMYGKGLYTVFDLTDTPTAEGVYGEYIYKLKINLHGFIIFDSDVAAKVYGKALTPAEQAKLLGLNDKVVQHLKTSGAIEDYDEFSDIAAARSSGVLAPVVKGIVFTGKSYGRVVVIYDPAVAVPVSWKEYYQRQWQTINKSSLKAALSRSASDEWQPGRWDTGTLLRNLANLPPEKRVYNGLLDLSGLDIKSLPTGLRVMGSLDVSSSTVTTLPSGLFVGKNLYLGPQVSSLSAGTEVRGNIFAKGSKIKTLPPDIKVSKSLSFRNSEIESLPDGLHIEDLDLTGAPIAKLPSRLVVTGHIMITDTQITELPPDLRVGDAIFGFRGDVKNVPSHLKLKVFE